MFETSHSQRDPVWCLRADGKHSISEIYSPIPAIPSEHRNLTQDLVLESCKYSDGIARHVGLRHGEGHGVEVVDFNAVAKKK